MTRGLREPLPETHYRPDPSEVAGKGKAHAAIDATFDPLICRKFTGKVKIEIDMNEGGLRAIKIGTEEVFKPSS